MRLAPLFALALVACGSAASSDIASGSDDITDVPNSPVKEQSIGNCWIYASVGWVESLHLSATRETLDLSESYVTYWHWYEQIVGKTDNAALETGGFFQQATKLMSTYGLAREQDFVPGEGGRSMRQAQALAAMNAALAVGGRLGKVADRTPANVRAALDDAFQLTPEVRADLKSTFGEGAPRPIGADHAARFLAPNEIKVTTKKPGIAPAVTTLDQVVGDWEQVYVYGDETASRGALRRLQKTMHDALPALLVWNVDFASSQNDGSFRRRPTSHLDKWDGAHMTVVEDYQAYHVPNYGVVPAGVLVSDPKELGAALADQSRIAFLRIKNSWGFRNGPQGSDELKGYYDLYEDYLFGMRAITGVIVPKAYDDSAPPTDADICAGKSGAYCAKSISNDASDKRLLKCENGASGEITTCEAGCSGQPAGVPDVCVDTGGHPAPPPANPCKTGARSGAGHYCGASLGTTDSNLYSCQKDSNGNWLSPFVACPRGCAVQPPGIADHCK